MQFPLSRIGGQSRSRHRSGWLLASVALVLAFSQLSTGCYEVPTVAFPGAEGFGAFAVGGRGGRVIEVTNLDDLHSNGSTVAGSLRAAIEATGPRIVVFRVSGTINVCEQDRRLQIANPYITIAGQTAPGDGITLRLDPSCSGSALSIWTHDVVLRHVRIRPGSNPPVDDGGSDALSIAGANAHDIIVDHCSFSWATDENVDIGPGARNITIQHSIVSEALKDAPRPAVGPSGGYGMLIANDQSSGQSTDRITIHRNLFAHNWFRNPQISVDGFVDYRNNVIYDWGLHGLRVMDVYGPTRMNIVGNFAKAGPSTSTTSAERELWAYHSIGEAAFAFFVSSNIGPSRPSPSHPELDFVWCREHDDAVPDSGADCDPAEFSLPAGFATGRVTSSSPALAYDEVLANAGAILPSRDPVDERVVTQVRNGTGGTISSPNSVGGWPVMSGATAPADGDHDGMPNAWELQHGLSTSNGLDGALDADADGYTNVEEYLNGTDPLAPNLW